ncbi:peptidase family S58 [Mycena capillaripes]|nr:peptidase family S58 [Mycena capillaripes]
MTIPRCHLRELLPGIHFGEFRPGPRNSLTDVEGVLCHTESIHLPRTSTHGPINTGLTTILPRMDFFHHACYAGIFRLNGCGELTGSHWIEETGLLHSPIVLTNSYAVGAAHQGIYEHCIAHYRDADGDMDFVLPVVGETFDGICNDIAHLTVQPSHIVRGIERASADAVPEGNTGGGTGMVCHGMKGGTGCASRVVPAAAGAGKENYTVSVLVQANYGRMRDFHVRGAPVGRRLWSDREKAAEANSAEAVAARDAMAQVDSKKDKKDGSILIVIATDAPLHPVQLQRLAKRATMGLARVGGMGHNPSGDIFLAFSTANKIPVSGMVDIWKPKPAKIQVLDDRSINGLFEAAADSVEEAILNAVCMAESMVGVDGLVVEALPLDVVKEVMQKHL